MAEVLKIEPRPKTKEKIWREFERKYLSEPIPLAKPKPKPMVTSKPMVTLEVEPATAERVRARPDSVRISTVREDTVPALERVRPREIVQPLEVDEAGRVHGLDMLIARPVMSRSWTIAMVTGRAAL
jgi:hypothetical protein